MYDLYTINTDKRRREQHKAMTGPTIGNEIDIINIASGSGVVDYLWLADRPGAGGGFPQFDHSIRVYVDGSATPVIDMDLGLFFGYAYGEVFSQENITSKHWHARSGTNAHVDRYGGGIRLPMPFGNGIRIAVACLNATPASAIFSQVDYRLTADNANMTIPPYRLNTTGNKWINGRINGTVNSDMTLATIPSGNPGIIVGHSMAAGAASDYSYLERYIATYVDGEATPSIKSSGTEDWFTASDYFFTGQTPFSSYGAMGLGACPFNNSGTPVNGFSALVDLLALNGGIPFTSDVVLKMLIHPAATATFNYANCLFYYRHI